MFVSCELEIIVDVELIGNVEDEVGGNDNFRRHGSNAALERG